MLKSKLSVFVALPFLLLPYIAFAQNNDLFIKKDAVQFETQHLIEGQKTRIYATVSNGGTTDLYGNVTFSIQSNGKQIGGNQPVSVFAGKTDGVFVDWNPVAGNHTIIVNVIPSEKEGDDPSNNSVKKTVYVEPDFDQDGISDNNDSDDDNDGVADEKDNFPKNKNEQTDSDGDGIGNNADPDDDNDNTLDENDAFPLDPNEQTDSDGDGIGNNADPDDDNDGLVDGEEVALGTDTLNSDSDSDGTNDKNDDFPLDEKEQFDTDSDGTGNNMDTDDDNDGIPDETDPFPTNIPPIIKVEGLGFFSFTKKIKPNATPSKDPDGKIVHVQWNIQGEESEGIQTSHTFEKPGKYEIAVRVTDNVGETVFENYTVYIISAKEVVILLMILLAIILAILRSMQYSPFASKRKSK